MASRDNEGGPLGKSFNDQWHGSKRAGEYKRSRGEGAWAEDKYLKRVNKRLSGPPAHHASRESSCGKSTVSLLAFLGGFAWAFDATVRYLT